MKTIYIEGTPSYHEQEEMYFKYAIYEEETLIGKKEIYHDYRKPPLTGLYSIMLLLKEIPEFKGEEIKLIVNDGALIEQIKGTSTTKNRDIIKVAELTRKHIRKFSDHLSFVSVAGNHLAMKDWNKKLNI